MKTETNRANSPYWRTLQSKVRLPERLSILDELIHNLWWTWNSDAQDVFAEIEPQLWEKESYNPILVLQKISPGRVQEIRNDEVLTHKIRQLLDRFRNYMSKGYDEKKPSVAYFSMEYGFTHILKTYSGGLGILAGDYLKEVSDYRVDLTGIGLLYRYGYFTQHISPEGYQVAEYEMQNFKELPIKQVLDENNCPMVLAVPFYDRNIYVNIWEVNIGRIKLYLMDSDNEFNSEFDSPITHQLYGGDWENRIKQEYLLGVGGILLLEKLGIKKDIYHCNEGHAAFMNLQRLVNLIEKEKLNFDQALEVVRSSSLYTVHTPVPAGHDYFDENLLGKYMWKYPDRLGISWQEFMNMGREHPDSYEPFSMSVFALNTCLFANGVSLLHGKVSRQMFQPVWPGYYAEELHVGHVTNGVHMSTWAAKETKELYEKTFSNHFYKDQSNHDIWNKINDVPDKKIWELRINLKKRFLEYVAEQMKKGCIKSQIPLSKILPLAENFNPEALLVGFGRRFATYKRAHLLFSDLNRLSKLLNNPKYPIHFIFAGKAHPADGMGNDLIKYIIEISRRPEFLGKIIFLENYDMLLAQRLVSGVDIWLNTPTRLQEASGTSGEKALMNGVLNFSVLDGWWYEGYRENAGWYLSDEITYTNSAYQDEVDAILIYFAFEYEILPIYYERNKEGLSPKWIKYIKNSISKIAPEYTTKRMMDDYIQKYYNPLTVRLAMLKEKDYEKAKELAAWKSNTVANWDNIIVESITITDKDNNEVLQSPLLMEGEVVKIDIVLDKKQMIGDLGVDLVLTWHDIIKNEYVYYSSEEISFVKKDGSKLYFHHEYVMKQSGGFCYSYRIFPKHPDMSHRMDFPCVKWI
ncbi:MAG: alpha-glucan family phosphorylase [Bacteroidales bacterium]|nr:alpha-glucan family phosphorylase [Bacteroidales bacterium]